MAERYIEPQKDARSYICPHCNTTNACTDTTKLHQSQKMR